jgi:hypothetical protein
MTSMTIGVIAAAGGSGSTAEAVSALFVVGSSPLMMAHATIVWFNRPKFLVPPHRRGETGSVIEWWRHRRALRAALGQAARRDRGDRSPTGPHQSG